jgi:hypothetical protein
MGDTVVMEESWTVHPFKATIFGFVDGDGGTVMLGFGIGEHRGIGWGFYCAERVWSFPGDIIGGIGELGGIW